MVLPSSAYLFTAGVEVVYFHLITLRHTPQSVGLLWKRDRPVAETSTWQHKHCIRDKHPCLRWVSNPRTQQPPAAAPRRYPPPPPRRSPTNCGVCLECDQVKEQKSGHLLSVGRRGERTRILRYDRSRHCMEMSGPCFPPVHFPGKTVPPSPLDRFQKCYRFSAEEKTRCPSRD
jgi:hypothetical protein